MGLSHVLFTAANGSRHWGPLPFTLRPLGEGGWSGAHGVRERNRIQWHGHLVSNCPADAEGVYPCQIKK